MSRRLLTLWLREAKLVSHEERAVIGKVWSVHAESDGYAGLQLYKLYKLPANVNSREPDLFNFWWERRGEEKLAKGSNFHLIQERRGEVGVQNGLFNYINDFEPSYATKSFLRRQHF